MPRSIARERKEVGRMLTQQRLRQADNINDNGLMQAGPAQLSTTGFWPPLKTVFPPKNWV